MPTSPPRLRAAPGKRARLAALRERLEQSERNAVIYASSKDIVALDSVRDADGKTVSQRTLAGTDLEALNEELGKARAERVIAESRAKAGSAENTPEVLANPTITQRELAVALGVSLGRINYGLRALIERGLIKVNNFKRSETKLAYAYLLTPSGVTEKSALTKAFLARKMQEFDALKKEIEALQLQMGDTDRLKDDNGQ